MTHAGPIAVMKSMITTWKADNPLTLAVQNFTERGSLKYLIGVDSANQPPVALAPMVCMAPGDYQRDVARSSKNRVIKVGLVIVDKRMRDGDGNPITIEDARIMTADTIVMAGLEALEAIVPALEKALEQFWKTVTNDTCVPGTINTEIYFPQFRATWDYTFRERYI